MGPYLSSPKKEKETHSGQGRNMIFACSEMQGWRNTMEDAAITVAQLDEDTSVYGVFDGHGGREAAKFVERHFIEELKKNPNFIQKDFEKALTETFLKMDELILTPQGQQEIHQLKASTEEEGSYAGCTANVALIYKNTLYVANAGDSRSVLCRNEQPHDMSVDHKPDTPSEKARIEKAGGFVSDGRVNGNLNLSRALGDMEYKKDKALKVSEQLISPVPEVKKVELNYTSDKFLLMGCDGVFETYNHQELLDFINDSMKDRELNEVNLKSTAERLLDHLLAPNTSNGVGCDNMTTVIIYFKNSK